jgi:putative ABC transport system permease protein
LLKRFKDYTGEAFAAIWRNRMRSILTMLGMIIGTSSIIAVLGVSHAASGGITDTLNSFGNAGISISPDPNQDDPQSAAIQYRDVRAIEAGAGDLITHIEPGYQRSMTMRVGSISSSSAVASDGDYHPDSIVMREGRRLSTADLETGAHVCDASSGIADKLFPNSGALGNTIEFGGTRCTVVGVYDEIKGSFFNSIGSNEFITIPYTSFHEIAPGPIDALAIYPAPGVSIPEVSDTVSSVLRRLHGPRTKYTTSDNQGFINGFNATLSVIAIGLTAIGGVALVVAGIGIMNIMLVSVTERTREIGLRKAIGARRADIALQFLLEAIWLSLIGGGIGTLIGFFVTLAAYGTIASLVGPSPIPYLLIISVSVGFSTMVGCVFGTFPAISAARLDPIAALRS